MARFPPPSWIIFGPSGCGKTTVGKALAERLGVPFKDADSYHPEANVAKMSRGEALDDEDRWPWLERLNRLLREGADGGEGADGRPVVLACSALKRVYRERLGEGVEGLRWVLLDADRDVLLRRMTGRNEAGTHFMPAKLLDSQLATLERPGEGEDVLVLDAERGVGELVEAMVERAGKS